MVFRIYIFNTLPRVSYVLWVIQLYETIEMNASELNYCYHMKVIKVYYRFMDLYNLYGCNRLYMHISLYTYPPLACYSSLSARPEHGTRL